MEGSSTVARRPRRTDSTLFRDPHRTRGDSARRGTPCGDAGRGAKLALYGPVASIARIGEGGSQQRRRLFKKAQKALVEETRDARQGDLVHGLLSLELDDDVGHVRVLQIADLLLRCELEV